jgi:hypothetical protein
MLYRGLGSRVARLSERAATLAVPIVACYSLWVAKSMASSVIETAIERQHPRGASDSRAAGTSNLGWSREDKVTHCFTKNRGPARPAAARRSLAGAPARPAGPLDDDVGVSSTS